MIVSGGHLKYGGVHWRAKLSEADVLAIRIISPNVTSTAIARQYGVCKKTIQRIRKGGTWRHLHPDLGSNPT
jgi:hypothetical protein